MELATEITQTQTARRLSRDEAKAQVDKEFAAIEADIARFTAMGTTPERKRALAKILKALRRQRSWLINNQQSIDARGIESLALNRDTFHSLAYFLRRLWHRFKPLEMFSDACSICNGTSGFVSQYDPSPSGVSLASGWYYDFDECGDCASIGFCPSCGTKLSDADADFIFRENDNECPFCRWTLEKGKSRYAPDEGEPFNQDCEYLEPFPGSASGGDFL